MPNGSAWSSHIFPLQNPKDARGSIPCARYSTPSSTLFVVAALGALATPRLPYSRKTVYHYFRLRRIDGTWEKLNAAIRERLRVRASGVIRNPPQASSILSW
jgi:hypothetical protein